LVRLRIFFLRMVETVGRRLQKARQDKNLTIDEVATATKIRPERIADLEADDLTHFPSLVYARSFLVKYAKFLGVDIQDDLDNFKITHSVGLGEFKYLAAAPAPRYRPEPRSRESRSAPAPPVALAVVAVLILVGVPLVAFFAINLSRLSTTDEGGRKVRAATQAPMAGNSPDVSQEAGASPTISAEVSSVLSSPSTSASAAPTVEVRRALPVDADFQKPEPSGSPSPADPAPQKLEIKVKERTWLRVTKDQQNSEPVFNNFIGPNSPAIVVQGKRFWLKAVDKNVLELRKNGQAVNGQDSDIVIE
jgi:cytoskeleton protein RodZ